MIRTVWMALLLSACGPWGLKEEGDSGDGDNEGTSADLDGDTDVDTDVDSDTDADADTDSDTDTDTSEHCQPDSCDANATCADTTGSIACTCNDGYEGDGSTCTDIDECTLDTDGCDHPGPPPTRAPRRVIDGGSRFDVGVDGCGCVGRGAWVDALVEPRVLGV